MPRGRCVGYMEYGFMSTTSSKETALQYSGVRKAGTKPMASVPPPPGPSIAYSFYLPPSHLGLDATNGIRSIANAPPPSPPRPFKTHGLASFCGIGESRGEPVASSWSRGSQPPIPTLHTQRGG